MFRATVELIQSAFYLSLEPREENLLLIASIFVDEASEMRSVRSRILVRMETMQILLIVHLLAVLLSHHVFAQELAANVTILNVEEGKKAIEPCSREGPKKVTAVWLPAAAEVVEAEERLQNSVKGFLKIPLEKYYRQYVGVVIDNKRSLYMHAFEKVGRLPIEETMPSWRSRYVRICDGRDASWGIEFDLTTKKFKNFQRNGP